jgi:hypothetical protein
LFNLESILADFCVLTPKALEVERKRDKFVEVGLPRNGRRNASAIEEEDRQVGDKNIFCDRV